MFIISSRSQGDIDVLILVLRTWYNNWGQLISSSGSPEKKKNRMILSISLGNIILILLLLKSMVTTADLVMEVVWLVLEVAHPGGSRNCSLHDVPTRPESLTSSAILVRRATRSSFSMTRHALAGTHLQNSLYWQNLHQWCGPSLEQLAWWCGSNNSDNGIPAFKSRVHRHLISSARG